MQLAKGLNGYFQKELEAANYLVPLNFTAQWAPNSLCLLLKTPACGDTILPIVQHTI